MKNNLSDMMGWDMYLANLSKSELEKNWEVIIYFL